MMAEEQPAGKETPKYDIHIEHASGLAIGDGAHITQAVGAEQTEPLTWSQLQKCAASISERRMACVWAKYSPDLYMQRQDVLLAFERFLASDKACFVLTGKSGVGKSNFLLALVQNYRQEYPNVCLLMYNGGKLDAQEPLASVVNHDIAGFLQQPSFNSGQEANDHIWREIDRIDGIADRRVVLCFDAINENLDAAGLFRQIDKLVEESRWPWLKVLITARSEAWREIQQPMQLAPTRYYHDTGQEHTDFEIKPFTYSQCIEPFAEDELPVVYEKYARFHDIQTPYDQLSGEAKLVLSDPLSLSLVSYIYRHGEIPANIRTRDIYDGYLSTKRLTEEDQHFLENKLVPLMIRQDSYSNTITDQDIRGLIYDDTAPSSGKRSYHNLLDAEILVQYGGEHGYEVGFKYERFYDYFSGRRLQTMAEELPDKLDLYGQVGAMLSTRPFLWGVLVQALVLELAKEHLSILEDLLPHGAHERLFYGALLAALIQFGQDYRARAEALIRHLIGPMAVPRTFFSEIWHLLLPEKGTSTVTAQQRIAIEAVGQLGMTRLLEEAVATPTAGVSAVAAQHTFYLWQRDPAAGFQILHQVSRRTVGRFGLPNLNIARSVLAISAAMLGQKTSDSHTLEQLLHIGRQTIRQVLLLSPTNQKTDPAGLPHHAPMKFFRLLVLQHLLGFFIRILTGWKGRQAANEKSLGHIFALSRKQKDFMQTLLPLINPTQPGLAERLPDILQVLWWGDQMVELLVTASLVGHGVLNIDATLPVLEKMVGTALNERPPAFWIFVPVVSTLQILARQETPYPELRDLIEKAVAAVQEDPDGWRASRMRGQRVPRPANRAAGLAMIVGASYVLQKQVRSALLATCLEKAMANRDDEYLQVYVAQELVNLFDFGHYRAAVRALQPIAGYDSLVVRESIIALLVRARRYDAEAVEDLLRRGTLPAKVVRQVRAFPTNEQIHDLMTPQLGNVILDLFLFRSKLLCEEMQWLLAQALRDVNLRGWMNLTARELFNLLAGEVVFDVPKDAPSRQPRQSEAAELDDGSQARIAL